jgi:hypothetical protein
MLQPFLAIFRETFNKEKYINGYLCHRCAIIQLKHRILKRLKILKSIVQNVYHKLLFELYIIYTVHFSN